MTYLTPSLPPMQWTLSAASNPSFGKGDRHVSSAIGDLIAVNAEVNAAIVPLKGGTRPNEPWLISPESGWCGDYAATKQRELIKRGWPQNSLLLAEVITQSGEHHAVLVVKLNVGYLVLDSLTDELRTPKNTNYRWVRMQNANDPSTWSKWRE